METVIYLLIICLIIFIIFSLLPIILPIVLVLIVAVTILLLYARRKFKKSIAQYEEDANAYHKQTFNTFNEHTRNDDVIDVEFTETQEDENQ